MKDGIDVSSPKRTQRSAFDWDPRAEAVRQDQRAAYDELRDRCPVAHSELLPWSVFRHEDVLRILHDHETFSNQVSAHLSVPNGMDPPEHTPYRRLIEPYFGPEPMRAFEPVCRKIAVDLMDQVLEQLGPIEWIDAYARTFAVRIQCAFLGWPEEMEAALADWTRINHEATLAQDRAALRDIAATFQTHVERMLQVRRDATPGTFNDVTTSLMNERIEGRPLTDEEITSILRSWTAGEVGSIAASLGTLAHFLGEHPDLQTTLRQDPSLLPEAIDEILRLDGPLVANRRIAARDVEVGGRQIAAGERLTLMWVAANRDEAAFEDAASFRFGRDPKANLLYGAGIHVCPGAPLARLEMRVVMEELLARTAEIRVDRARSATRAVYPAGGFASLYLRLSRATT